MPIVYAIWKEFTRMYRIIIIASYGFRKMDARG